MITPDTRVLEDINRFIEMPNEYEQDIAISTDIFVPTPVVAVQAPTLSVFPNMTTSVAYIIKSKKLALITNSINNAVLVLGVILTYTQYQTVKEIALKKLELFRVPTQSQIDSVVFPAIENLNVSTIPSYVPTPSKLPIFTEDRILYPENIHLLEDYVNADINAQEPVAPQTEAQQSRTNTQAINRLYVIPEEIFYEGGGFVSKRYKVNSDIAVAFDYETNTEIWVKAGNMVSGVPIKKNYYTPTMGYAFAGVPPKFIEVIDVQIGVEGDKVSIPTSDLTLQTEAQTQSSRGTPTPTPVISMEIGETFTGFVKRDYKVGCTDNVIKKGTPVSGIIYESNVKTCSGVDSDSDINLQKGIDVFPPNIAGGSASFVPLSELTTEKPTNTTMYIAAGIGGLLVLGIIGYMIAR